MPVGDEPHGVRTDRSGKTIYVLNTSSDDISVIDAATLKEEKRLSASRSPWALALSPDGGRLLVTNALSRFVKFREPSALGGDGARHRAHGRRRPVRGPRGQPAAGRRLAPPRRVCDHHPAANQEPRADDPDGCRGGP